MFHLHRLAHQSFMHYWFCPNKAHPSTCITTRTALSSVWQWSRTMFVVENPSRSCYGTLRHFGGVTLLSVESLLNHRGSTILPLPRSRSDSGQYMYFFRIRRYICGLRAPHVDILWRRHQKCICSGL